MFICENELNCCDYYYADTIEDLDTESRKCIHLVEVEKVKHGKWSDGISGNYKIYSECLQTSDFDFDYCPNYGGKMDLEE